MIAACRTLTEELIGILRRADSNEPNIITGREPDADWHNKRPTDPNVTMCIRISRRDCAALIRALRGSATPTMRAEIDRLQKTICALIETQRQLLDEAFERGRFTGWQEATDDLKQKLYRVLDIPMSEFVEDGRPHTRRDRGTKRSNFGAVKPTIERMIIESANTGLTIREIEKVTSFKYNSVRTTLWTLGKHGKVVQRDDHWFPVEH